MQDHKPVIPENWTSLWSDAAVAFLKPLIRDLQYAFTERDLDVFIQLWQPGHNPRGSFVSVGLRTQGLQSNGNSHSIYYAFGFFYETAFTWPKSCVDYYADRCAAIHAEIINGTWPPANAGDDEVLRRNANISAPEARRTNAHVGTPAQFIIPTKRADCDVKKLNAAMEEVMTDQWGEPIEVDPLS